MHDSVAGPLGEVDDSSRIVDGGRVGTWRQMWCGDSPPRRHRDCRLGKRRAVRQGSGFGGQRVGFRSRVRRGQDPRCAVDVHRHRRQIPRGGGSVAYRYGGVGCHAEQPQGVVADEAAGGRAGGQPQVGRPVRWRGGEFGGLLVASLRLRLAASDEQQSGKLDGQLRRLRPSALLVGGPGERGTGVVDDPVEPGAPGFVEVGDVRPTGARREPRGTTARGRPGSGPAHPPRRAARRRYWRIVSNARYLVGSPRSTTSRLCSARRASPSAISARVRGRLPRRPRPRRRRTTRRRRRPRAAAPDRRTRAGRSSSRSPRAASRGGRRPAVPAVRSRNRWSRPDSNPSRPSAANRAAASSMASAMPSNARHSAATRTRSGGVVSPVAAATRVANRSTASPPPPMTDSPGYDVHPLVGEQEPRTARRQYGDPRAAGDDPLDAGPDAVENVLAIVEDEQCVAVGEHGDQRAGRSTWCAAQGRRRSRRPPRGPSPGLSRGSDPRTRPRRGGPGRPRRRRSARAGSCRYHPDRSRSPGGARRAHAVSAARSPVRPMNGVTGTGRPRLPDLTRRPGMASACRAKLRRSVSCSFRSIAETWLSTVRVEMNSASAICAFVRCRAIRARISASRAVTSALLAGPTVVTPSSVPLPSVLSTQCPRSVVATDVPPVPYGEPGQVCERVRRRRANHS